MAVSELLQKEDKKIPQEVRGIIEALAEPSRRGITMILAENTMRKKRGEELSFKELLALVKPMNPSTLNHHLKGLMEAGLVENIYMKKESTSEYSFYKASELAIDFLKMVGARLE
ncbi:MAG TPA: winged helix-turn-helix domain-containing protein [Nitrososphaerales archaeon]|nr:winged helix-turn-helix domain-containing protein [Nitrososphaerales archaeon]